VVAIATLRTGAGEVASVGYLMGVFELILLLAALTLPRVQVVPLALAAIACQAALGLRTGADLPFLVATVLTLAAFSLAATVAGARMVELAARRALDVVAGEQARAHGAELARANAEIAAQRDQLVAARQQAVTLTQLVVHDLRNPLSSILQFISLAGTRVREQGGLGDVEEDLRLAGEEGQRLAGMVATCCCWPSWRTAPCGPGRSRCRSGRCWRPPPAPSGRAPPTAGWRCRSRATRTSWPAATSTWCGACWTTCW
jgi:signal transduction histidine kinase